MHKNVPNILTIIRIICIPIILSTFYFNNLKFAQQLGAGLFLLASLTDFFDGYFARKYGLQSNFGEMFDPIADKVLVGVVIVMLVKFNKANEIPALLILAREFTIAGLREFLAQLRVSVPVTFLAKIKTAVQMGALFILILAPQGDAGHWLNILGNMWLWAAALLTVFTGISYFKATLKYITNE